MPVYRIASYNIHGCVGLDRRHAPRRIAGVIRQMGPHIVGLQEVDTIAHEEGALDQLDYLAKATSMEAVAGPTLAREVGHYGNGILTRFAVKAVRRLDLSVPGREPRGLLDVDLDMEGVPLRVLVTHFGLRTAERRAQVQILLRLLKQEEDRPAILLGDFNEWNIKGRVVQTLDAALGPSVAVKSYPSWWPVWSLDRIWFSPGRAVMSCAAHATPASRLASDHLPVVAEIDL